MNIPMNQQLPQQQMPSAMPVEMVGGYAVPQDPMDMLHCDSCQ
ncbi:hypothetical protein M2120_000004 [Aurantimicrobium minutum]|nr:hypothetical protein [Aurantimicrobium minutum]